MKIISWNCNQKFREKFKLLEEFDADILVIQECENPEYSKLLSYRDWANNYLWVGDNKHKGLGVFAKQGIKISKLNWSNNGCELFLPFIVNDNLEIVAVWTKGASSKSKSYIAQLWRYIETNQETIKPSKTIFVGDFNSNAIWDKERIVGNHTDVVNKLEQLNIFSIYHAKYNITHGNEVDPTILMYRDIQKPYHIDYAFIPKDLLNDSIIEIGKPEKWLNYSDHMPLFIQI